MSWYISAVLLLATTACAGNARGGSGDPPAAAGRGAPNAASGASAAGGPAANPDTGGTSAGSAATPPPSAPKAAAPAAGSGGSTMQPDADANDIDAGTPPETSPREQPQFEATGEPLTGSSGRWTFIELADTQCRDGSRAGVYLNPGTANKLMIYLEGGGRCANEQTCAALNPANIAGGDLVRSVASSGVLDRSKAQNPVRDWNFVIIPYCTGDRHGGANPDGNVPGVGPQKFVGYTNLQKYLNHIVPTFRDTTDVLLTGISAGGFGVAYSAVLVQRAFPNLKIRLVIDSAPFVSNAVFKACDQRLTRELYKAEQTFLGECGAACPNPNDYWADFGVFFAKQFGDRPWGLISTTEDLVERAFFGIGANECAGALDLLNPPISAAAYRAELLGLRTKLGDSHGFTTFYPEADTHTFLAFDEFYTVSAGGVRLVDWFTKIVNGEKPDHAGP